MKKIFLSLFSLIMLANISLAQGKFAASISNVANTVTFKLKPIGGNVTTGLSTVEFFVRYANAGPAFTYSAVTPNTTNFPGMTATGTLSSGSWEIERDLPLYVLPGYHTDHFIYTEPAPNTTVQTYTNGVEYEIIKVNLLGATNTVDLQFIHQDFEISYYLAITSEVGGDLRPAAFTNYFYPITTSSPGPSGSTFYYAALNSTPIPIKFGGFTASKKENGALLSWWVENETALTDHYEVERSLNGIDFIKVIAVAPKNNGNSSNTYTLTDQDLNTFRSIPVVYYRIKQVDKDGKFTSTEIRTIRLGSGITIGVYPNPVKDAANLTLDLEEAGEVMIVISDAAGKEVKKIIVQGNKGLNNKKITMNNMASGSYLFKVTVAGEVKTLPVVKTQ